MDWRKQKLKPEGPSSFTSLVVEVWPGGKLRIASHYGKVKDGVFAVESVASKSSVPTDVDTALEQFDDCARMMKQAINRASDGSPKD